MFGSLVALIRPKHWIKNGLVFVPLIFSGSLFNWVDFEKTLGAFVAFSLAASIVYIVNDLRDIEKDRKHPKKRFRPLASGVISTRAAVATAIVLGAVAVLIGMWAGLPLVSWLLIALYVATNIAYSFGLKNIPIVDIAILSAGFVIRVLYGAAVINIAVSSWLYMTVLAGALYMALGKRRNEIQRTGTKSRAVNKRYSISFLDKNMYVCMALLLVFYSLWATDSARGDSSYLYLTIPLLILVFMTYSLSIESDTSSGDPVDMLSGNKPLAVLAAVYVLVTIALVYI